VPWWYCIAKSNLISMVLFPICNFLRLHYETYIHTITVAFIQPRVYQHKCEKCFRPVAKEYHWTH
jgi:hypothetical protein